MPNTIDITIETPCSGSHTVTESSPDLYFGGPLDGDFDLVVLAKNGDCWYITVYDYDTSSACYPSTVYRQDPCDPAGPDGDYGLWDGTAVKPKLGRAKIVK